MYIEEYDILKNIILEKKEYAQIAHIINSKKMKLGKNIVHYETYVYKVLWLKFDNWKIYDKVDIEESKDLYDKRN